jgi:hypothetical protein
MAPPPPPHNDDDDDDYFYGPDDKVEIRTRDRFYPEFTIQRLYKSSSSKLLTTTIKKRWAFEMNLRPGDYIIQRVTADRNQLIIEKVELPDYKKKLDDALKADSEAAADEVDVFEAIEAGEVEGPGAVVDASSVPLSKSSG